MKTFRYTHSDPGGNKSEGTISAKNKAEALAKLSESDLLVLSLEVETSPSQKKLLSVFRILAICALLCLVSIGAYIGLTQKVESDTAGRKLMAAIQQNKKQQVKNLIQSEPDLVNLPNTDGVYPIHLAVALGQEGTVQRLLGARASLEQKASNGGTPLLWAIDTGSIPMVELLLQEGANDNVTDDLGNGPLHYAALHESPELTELILERGTDPNSTNKEGQSALHWAAKENSPAVVEALVAAGADPNLQDAKGRSPLHLCAEEGHLEVTQTLLALGALKSAENTEQQTPEDIAQAEEFADTAALLKN